MGSLFDSIYISGENSRARYQRVIGYMKAKGISIRNAA